jgi:hypothetical protein
MIDCCTHKGIRSHIPVGEIKKVILNTQMKLSNCGFETKIPELYSFSSCILLIIAAYLAVNEPCPGYEFIAEIIGCTQAKCRLGLIQGESFTLQVALVIGDTGKKIKVEVLSGAAN